MEKAVTVLIKTMQAKYQNELNILYLYNSCFHYTSRLFMQLSDEIDVKCERGEERRGVRLTHTHTHVVAGAAVSAAAG